MFHTLFVVIIIVIVLKLVVSLLWWLRCGLRECVLWIGLHKNIGMRHEYPQKGHHDDNLEPIR